ncbi:peptidase [Campylobacterota bacterium]|nr:peptidase [Campylobacterota bacterium]
MNRLWCFLLPFAVANLLCANDLVDIYRTKGIGAAEERINDMLRSRVYWLDKLDQQDTRFGYFEEPKKTLFVVDKTAASFAVYSYENGKLTANGTHKATLGDAQGDKFVEGDKKTPVGTYKITSLLTSQANKLDPYYGPLAYTTNYPNYLDKKLGKSGHGIWIHGFPLNGARNNENSEGCVVIDNDLLRSLQTSVQTDQIVVMINENGVLEASKDDIAAVLATIFQWRWVWKNNDISAYLALYAEDFKRSDGLNRVKFDTAKRQIFARRDKKVIELTDIEVVPYPNSQGQTIFRVRFWQNYEAASHKSSRVKELYVRKQNDQFAIIMEH